MKKQNFIVAIVAFILVILFGIGLSTASMRRSFKSFSSEFNGGLERIVYVYDNAGNLITTYEGLIDVQENQYGNKVLFDLNGKRVVLYNVSVIVEEQ